MGYAICRRPPTNAHCFRIADFWHLCERIFAFLMPEPIIWHAWGLDSGVPGHPGTISGGLGGQQRTLWGPGLLIDFLNFFGDFGTLF